METIQQLHEQLLAEWAGMKDLHTKAIETAQADGRQATNLLSEHKEMLERMTARLDAIEVRMARPGSQGDADPELKSPEEKVFSVYTRKGVDPLDAAERKALTVGDDAQGGYVVPTNRADAILRTLIQFSPIREMASVVTIATGTTWEQPKESSTRFVAHRAAETAARPETTAAKVGLEMLRCYDAYANPFATQNMLDDAGYDFDSWLNDRIAMAFAVLEGTEFVSGTGVGESFGLLGAAAITELTALSQVVVSGSATELTGDGIINLQMAVPEYYARNGTFIAKRQTFGAMRILKDGLGQYLWQPGLAAGLPNTFLGRPYREAIDMPAVTTAAYPLIFGDIRAAYTILDRQQMIILRDPYSNKPYVELYTTKRFGGQPTLAEAYAVQSIST